MKGKGSALDKRYLADRKTAFGMDKKTVKPVAKDTNKTRRAKRIPSVSSEMKDKPRKK